MRIEKAFKVILGIIVVMSLALNPLYAAPKNKVNKGKGKGRFVGQKYNSHNSISRKKNARNNALKRIHNLKASVQQDRKRLNRSLSQKQTTRMREHKQILKNLEDTLDKFEHSKWFQNSNDDRGQGNMGKVDMLDPYGHDKDSDRLALYGNRGRIIKIPEPVPLPNPEPVPLPNPEPVPMPEPEPEPDPPFIPPVLP